jgi:hypothetical protein
MLQQVDLNMGVRDLTEEGFAQSGTLSAAEVSGAFESGHCAWK